VPKLSIVRHVLGICLVLALLAAPGSVSVAHAQAPGPVPRGPLGPCGPIPCVEVDYLANWCWCPEQVVLFDPGDVQTSARFGFQVGVVNNLPVEVDLVDQTGALAAEIPPGATGQLAVPGPGKFAYTVVAPQLISPPTLTVVGLQN
jgi:hypothetical protein